MTMDPLTSAYWCRRSSDQQVQLDLGITGIAHVGVRNDLSLSALSFTLECPLLTETVRVARKYVELRALQSSCILSAVNCNRELISAEEGSQSHLIVIPHHNAGENQPSFRIVAY
jgi:hypothetical protein